MDIIGELLFFVPLIILGLLVPIYLIGVWRRWKKTAELVIAVILVPFLAGLISFGFGVVIGILEQQTMTAKKGVFGGPLGPFFLVVIIGIIYAIIGALTTLSSLVMWGPIWYFWRKFYPKSFWKMVYFRHRDRTEVLKDYDEQIKPEVPTPTSESKE